MKSCQRVLLYVNWKRQSDNNDDAWWLIFGHGYNNKKAGEREVVELSFYFGLDQYKPRSFSAVRIIDSKVSF
jgi:hypothetical protein